MPKKQPPKLGKLELTDYQRSLLAQNSETEFFKLITDVIIPQRIDQIALTSLHAANNVEDLFFYKGQAQVAVWIRSFLLAEVQKVDGVDYNNDDDDESSEEDTDI